MSLALASRIQEVMMRQAAIGLVSAVAVGLLAASAAAQQGPADFDPTYTFEGSQITSWDRAGQAQWSAANGVITGKAEAGGGWLFLDRSLQDLAFYSRFRCVGPCDAGILFQAERTPQGARGILLSLKPDDVGPYRVTIDVAGRVVSREFAGEGDRGADLSAASQGAGAAAAAAPTAPVLAEATRVLTAPITMTPGEWNSITVFIDRNEIRSFLDNARNIVPEGHVVVEAPAQSGGAVIPPSTRRYGYGPIALHVGSGQVEFDHVSLRDLRVMTIEPERTSEDFHVQRIDDFYYAWGADVADMNQDGVLDIISGPFYYLGPDFTTRHEFYERRAYNPALEYVNDMLTFAHDWTGDGWVDAVVTERRPIVLFVNPKGESRRWERFEVLPEVCSEMAVRADLFGDGRPAVLYVGRDGRVAFGRPDPANPTAPWPVNKISEPIVEGCNTHGIGAGDVNGDGRVDIVTARGWWEQPASGGETKPWTYRDGWFGALTRRQHPGGGEIAVYDFNGDGLNDIVTSLSAHSWGLSWYEQQRDAGGRISWREHRIMGDFSAEDNAGGVTFSQLHSGTTLIDVNRDGVMDFVTGKRHWSHLDSYGDPDPHGEAVIYWYETVRDGQAPGGVDFVPHLIHNRSGVGSEQKVRDINGDGVPDIVTAGTRGLFVFWGVAK